MLSITLFLGLAFSFSLDTTSSKSVCLAAKYIIDGEMDYYEGIRYGGTVGMFQQPYYWWHAAEAMNSWIDYYTYCQSDNSTLRTLIQDAIIHQADSNYHFEPKNQSSVEANDDQGMWGMALAQAVEREFPTVEGKPTWLEMLETMVSRLYDRVDDTCGGGLRWQMSEDRNGYTYKNTITNGILFNLAARLARYTSNDKYVSIASEIWYWSKDVGYIVEDDGYLVYDGGHVDLDCLDYDKTSWLYIYGVYMAGNAYLHSYTDKKRWLKNVQKLWASSSRLFFDDGVMYEPSCMDDDDCNDDQRAFRSLFARNLKLTSLLMSKVADEINTKLKLTSKAVAQLCSGGTDGVTCGQDWRKSGWDEVYGLGEQMCAMEVVLSNVVKVPSKQ